MTKPMINTAAPKSKVRTALEFILLTLCLCIIVLRTIFNEGPDIQTTIFTASLTGIVYSLVISTLLILLFVCWLISAFLSRTFQYRFSRMEIGLAVFVVAATFATAAAADKRAAVNNFVMLLSPILMAVLLIQLLDSNRKTNIFLNVASVLGAIVALYCLLQLLWVNQALIDQYENDPNTMLEKIGVTPGSFRHMLFEHRLYSKGVMGFFTTANSAGSFMLLTAFAAIALFISKCRKRSSNLTSVLSALVTAVITAVIVLGIVLTRSKGTIVALIAALAMLSLYLFFARRLKKYRLVVLSVCLLLIVTAAGAVVYYGITYDCLPGGKSMLVRWQYWKASAKMYTDHYLTGVGPGNFALVYPRYKPAEALETITDPHNFILSVLTQYGPLGLIGFLAAIFLPFLTFFYRTAPSAENQTGKTSPALAPVLFIGVFGFLLHNCIDFAIFEPGIYTLLWTIVALASAVHFNRHPDYIVIKPTRPAKILITIAALAVFASVFNYVLVPVVKSQTKIQLANIAYRSGRFDTAHQLLNLAAKDDILSDTALAQNSQLYLQRFYQTANAQTELLANANQSLLSAIRRNKANFKHFERLTIVYNAFAENSAEPAKTEWRKKAFETAGRAVQLYPNCGRLHLELAKLAEKLNKEKDAVEHYKKTIDIEDKYRQQFKIMYPQRESFSRLGEQKYQFAKKRLAELNPQTEK